MTRFILFFISFFGAMSMLNSQTYYVKLDTDCMDRYEFVTDIDKTPYVVYTSNNAEGVLTQLDVGKEPVKWIKNLPGQLTSCSAIVFDKAMTLAINNSTVKLYIVRESPTHYNISPVEKATYISSNSASMEVTMSDADFTLNWDKMVSNRNLGTPASTKEVFLEGTIKYQCFTGYIFKKKDTYQSDSFKEYTIIPQLGIISKRSAPYENAVTNSLRMNRANDYDAVDFMSNKCGMVKNVSNEIVNIDGPVNSSPGSIPGTTAKGGTPEGYNNYSNIKGPCPSSNRPGIHVVQKKETLYSISKRYGLTVQQIKSWNGIGKNNLISVCQELIVNQGSGSTAPKGNTNTGTSSTVNTSSNNMSTTKYHIVKPNESVSQLAAMYGYTEDRFRQMNSLGDYERIYAGQKVFTSDCDCPNTEAIASNVPMPYEKEEIARLTSRGNPDVYFRPIKIHSVKNSETLFAIARQYDTTVDRIKELNGLAKNAQLSQGQKLYVQ